MLYYSIQATIIRSGSPDINASPTSDGSFISSLIALRTWYCIITTVQQSLCAICENYGISVSRIMKLSKMVDDNTLVTNTK